MKKQFMFLSALCALFLLTNQLAAQVDMTWDTHGVGFKVPRGFVIETNNAEEFTASNDNLFLSILPIQDETITDDDLAEVVAAMAKEMDYDLVTDGDAVEIDAFSGYYVRGSKDGANAILMALLDAESSTNLIVVVVYAEGYEDEALMMANSFYAYD